MTSPNLSQDVKWMRVALSLAAEAGVAGEVPVGAVVIYEGEIVGKGKNDRESSKDPVGHAEIYAISTASKSLGRWRLTGCTLYVTLEPCFMCAGALINSRVDRVVFGARDPKGGAITSLANLGADPRLNHQFQITSGILEAECGELLKNFFRERRTNSNNC